MEMEKEGFTITELIIFLAQVLREKGDIPVKFWNSEYGEPERIDWVEATIDFMHNDEPIVLLK